MGVRVQVVSGVAHVVLDRPESANAIDLTVARGLLDAANRCARDSEVRAVLLRGEGRMFCAGGDLKTFAEVSDLPGHLTEVTQALHAAISRFARLDAPVVAAVHGSAAGAGFSLACSADLVLAADSARFAAAYARVGLSPDGSLSWYLPRLVGNGRALDLLLRNRVLTAEEAHAWGIVTEVVPAGELLSRATDLARELAAGPTRSFGAIKRLVRHSFAADLEAQLANETAELEAAAAREDGVEGIVAFVDKRDPKFRGC
jgi:2-(1,2-epoxy-1,2-dihydrophenyl)acetyl-CoA isomerase